LRLDEFELPALARVLPASLIREVLEQAEKGAKRQRKLPPELVVWLVVGMGLFRRVRIESVLLHVAGWLKCVRWGPAEVPHGTSIAQARDRLGWEAVRALFRRLTSILHERTAVLTSWRGREVYTLDGTCFMVPDTPENEAMFGRPRVTRGGTSGFPQLRALMLVGVWTHVVADVVLGPYTLSEMRLADHLLERLRSGTVLLMDRAYYGFLWPASFVQRGVDFVIRMKIGTNTFRVTKRRRLGRGDWLCEMIRPDRLKKTNLPEQLKVRMIKCPRKGFRPVYVITSLTSEVDYPADEIVALYRDRWEAELSYRELKTHLVGEKVSFRSKKPLRVLQEVYGLLIAYNCVRALLCEAGHEAGVRPIQLSFVDALEKIRSTLVAYVDSMKAFDLVARLGQCKLPKRRPGRRCERAVKIKFSSYPRKRKDRAAAPSPYINRARSRHARRRQRVERATPAA